jgi:hypothetical protein
MRNAREVVGGRLSLVVLAAGALAAVLLHGLAGFRYPVPWPDEAHFLAPARNVAAHLTLTAPEVNAPTGIFWMPDGYAVVMGVAYALLPDTVEVARLVSLALVLGFAGALYLVGVRLGGAPVAVACAVATWLVAPRVVLMANIARMEPLVLALIGVTLLTATAGRWLTALAMASLTALVHPSGFVVAVALAGAAVLLRADLRPKGRGELMAVVAVAVAWAAEGMWVLSHLDLARDHLGFQLARKSARSLRPNMAEIAVGFLAIAGVAMCVTGRRRLGTTRAALLCSLCALIGAFTAIRVAGNEMWYGALGYETSALLAIVAILALVPSPGRIALPAGMLALAPVILVAGLTLTGSAYEMTFKTGSPGDQDFLTQVGTELHAFDARQDGHVRVALDQSSGLSPFLFSQAWQHLSFVDPTPVTPLWVRPDYVLYSLGPPEPGRRRIAARLPGGKPALRIAGSGSTAQVLLFPGDRVDLPVP